ncbi:DnaJ C-terminal domain-containing protein, partial [Aliarcobacter butzleri]|uniref:DnaJ C-terminal domain-containing protein n=1 Tax=Aliarcobacter butzleri TaxID=28197 RepID=UPI003AD9B7C5
MRISVSNKGNIAPNAHRGDLYLQGSVKEESHFERHDDDIYFGAPTFFTQVALGGTIKVPSLRGEPVLEIPKGAKDR